MPRSEDKFILDATAANRTIYEVKDSDKIIFLDIERKLSRKPTIFADDQHLPFSDHVFHTIIFDPPYYWSNGQPDSYGIPDAETFNKVWGENRKYPRYYGTDKFKSRTGLVAYLHRSFSEFARVLTTNGLLWVKWSESVLSIDRFLVLCNKFELLLKIEVKDKLRTQGIQQTFWLALIQQEFAMNLDGFMKIPEEAKP